MSTLLKNISYIWGKESVYITPDVIAMETPRNRDALESLKNPPFTTVFT